MRRVLSLLRPSFTSAFRRTGGLSVAPRWISDMPSSSQLVFTAPAIGPLLSDTQQKLKLTSAVEICGVSGMVWLAAEALSPGSVTLLMLTVYLKASFALNSLTVLDFAGGFKHVLEMHATEINEDGRSGYRLFINHERSKRVLDIYRSAELPSSHPGFNALSFNELVQIKAIDFDLKEGSVNNQSLMDSIAGDTIQWHITREEIEFTGEVPLAMQDKMRHMDMPKEQIQMARARMEALKKMPGFTDINSMTTRENLARTSQQSYLATGLVAALLLPALFFAGQAGPSSSSGAAQMGGYQGQMGNTAPYQGYPPQAGYMQNTGAFQGYPSQTAEGAQRSQ